MESKAEYKLLGAACDQEMMESRAKQFLALINDNDIDDIGVENDTIVAKVIPNVPLSVVRDRHAAGWNNFAVCVFHVGSGSRPMASTGQAEYKLSECQ